MKQYFSMPNQISVARLSNHECHLNDNFMLKVLGRDILMIPGADSLK